jgi:hypothetical protein
MKKLLFLLSLFVAIGASAQTQLPPLGCPSCQLEIQGIHQDDSLYLMPYRQDTLIRPARAGGLVYAYGNAWLWTGSPLHWTLIAGISFGTIPGNVTAQTNLYDTILARQMQMIPGYGWKVNGGNQGLFDSAVVRKVDSMYKINDSTIAFLINGHTYSFLFRGSAGGSVVSSISINASPLFTGPVSYVNTSGNWSVVLGLQNQNPNTIFAGPASGSPGTPSVRNMVLGDLPTGIPNGNLQFSTMGLLIDQGGLVPAFSATSVSLGNNILLHLPWASAVAAGPLTAANWILFNAKVDSTTISNDSVYEWRSGAKTFRYFITGASAGLFNLNGLTTSTQTFQMGFTGTSPNISSSGSVHTFNNPLVNGVDTGIVPPSLYAAWNAKQPAISGNGFPYFAGSSITFYNGTSSTLYGTSSAGAPAIIALGTNLSITGNTLNATGGSGGNPNSNIGAGYRLAIPWTNNIKTLFGQFGLLWDSAINTNAITGFLDTTYVVTHLALSDTIAGLPTIYNDRADPNSDSSLVPSTSTVAAKGFVDTSTDGSVTITDLSDIHTVRHNFHAAGGGGTPANPTGTVGLATVNGSLTTYMRSDAAPPLSQAITPTWSGLHIFGGGLQLNSNVTIGTTNTYSIGTLADELSQVYTQNISSNGGLAISACNTCNITLAFNGTAQSLLGHAGQWQWNSYLLPSSFPVTAVGQLVFDASGNIGTSAIGGTRGLDSTITITGGSSSTVTNGYNIVQFNPTSLISSYTLTLPTTWHSSNDLLIAFTANGTITNGNPMVTTFTLINGSGQTLSQITAPTGTINAGTIIRYHLISGTVDQRTD